MHICVGNNTIIGSGNGLSPARRQAITWTNVGILSIGPLGTNFSEMLIEIHTFSFKKIHLKMSGKWRPFCLGLNVLTNCCQFIRIGSSDGLVVSGSKPLPETVLTNTCAVFQTQIFSKSPGRNVKKIALFIYYNFYLPRFKFNWSSPIFGRQGWLGDHKF